MELFFRANLGLGGLGVGSAVPVGVPLPWPAATAPTGWIKCNGASFNLTAYPNLALAYPSGVLPDLRGQFVRGWDDTRGVDPSRILLSNQWGTLIALDNNYNDNGLVGALGTIASSGGTANIYGDPIQMPTTNVAFQYLSQSVGFYQETLTAGTGAVTRPRNIAFNYIVRAA